MRRQAKSAAAVAMPIASPACVQKPEPGSSRQVLWAELPKALDVHQGEPARIGVVSGIGWRVARPQELEAAMKLSKIARSGALAAAAALAVGFSTAAAPADAQVRIGINLFGPGYYVPYYYPPYYYAPYSPYPYYGPYYAPYSYGPYYRYYRQPYYVPYYERYHRYR